MPDNNPIIPQPIITPDVITQQPPTPQQQQLNFVVNDVRNKVSAQDAYNAGDFSNIANSFADKRLPTTVQDVRVSEAYTTLGSGLSIPKFENFIPNTNNEERFALAQTSGEKWANGANKALLKTGSALLGGTVGIVYGVGEAFRSGEWESLYDNDFSQRLQDFDTKLQYKLPNYYTEQERDKNLFQQAGTANFWSDKFLGGLSFTAGAILSEAVWAYATGGTSLATHAARYTTKIGKVGRWGAEALGEAKTIEGIAKYTKTLKELGGQFSTDIVSKSAAINAAKTGEYLSTVGFMARSAGYEASVEALQYKKEAQENFYNSFAEMNGRPPSATEVQEFQSNLNKSANAVFGTNMAILGVSNLAMFGNISGIKNPIDTGISKFLEKKAFGYGVEKTAAGTYKTLEATTGQKVARNVFDYVVKPGATEAIYEEGGQGVTTKFANRWIEHTYDPKNTNQSFDSIGEMYESLAEQYGTKEGWVEVGLGLLIGVAGGAVNVKSEQKAKSQELGYEAAVATQFNSNTLQSMLLPNKIQTANRIAGFTEEAKVEQQAGNISKSALAQKSALLTYINAKQVLGEDISDTTTEIKNALDLVKPEEWKAAGITDIETHKEETLKEFTDLSNQWKTNKTYWQYMIGNRLVGENSLEATSLEEGLGSSFSKNAQIVEALAWQSTIGESAHKQMKEAQTVIAREVGQEYSDTLNLVSLLKKQSSAKRGEITKATNQYKALSTERDVLVKKIAKLNAAPKETEGDKVGFKPVAAMSERLLELEEKIGGLSTTLDNLAQEVVKSETYGADLGSLDFTTQDLTASFISGAELISLDNNIAKFKNTLASFNTSNKQRHDYLQDILSEYADSEEVFMQSQATQRVVLDPRFKLENIGGYISSKIKGKKDMNVNSKEWLQSAINTYSKYKSEGIANSIQTENENIISDAEYNQFIENGEVSPERLQNVAQKVKNNEPLNERENAIFVAKTSEINEIIRLENQEVKPKPIEAETVEIRSPIEVYKARIEQTLKNYNLTYIGENYDGVANLKPTEQEIEEYRQLKSENKRNKRFQEIQQKLSNWKLLDSATDEDNSSIVDILTLIEQLEQEVEAEETKTEVTLEDNAIIATSDEVAGVNLTTDYTLAQNTLANPKVVKPANSETYRFSHLKIRSFVEPLGGWEQAAINGKQINSESELDNLNIDDRVSIDGTTITYLPEGTLSMPIADFKTRQQALNMYITDTNSVKWSFKDIYTIKGNDFVKRDSDFTEDIDAQAIYDLKKGDKVSLVIKEDGWNQQLLDKYNRARTDKSKEEAEKNLKNQLKIYLVDSQRRRISTLKSQRKMIDEEFLSIRDIAFKRYMDAVNKDEVKTGIEVTVDSIFLGSPEIFIQDGQIQNMNFTDKAVSQVVATGFIKDGEFTLNKEIQDVDKTFVGRLSRNSAEKKVPVIVFKKGKQNIAYPISMIRTGSPKIDLFDSLLAQQLSPQEIIQSLNLEIQNQRINTPKLTYADINNQERLDEAREAFGKKQTYLTADDLASPDYKISNLTRDAVINIDLENLDRVLSDGKARLDLNNVEYTTEKDVKIDSLIEIEKQISDLAEEVYFDFVQNAATKYVDSKGYIVEDTVYTNAFDETPIVRAKSNIEQLANIKVLREAFSEKLPKVVQSALGEAKVHEIQTLLKYHQFVRQQITISPEDKSSGLKQTKCN